MDGDGRDALRGVDRARRTARSWSPGRPARASRRRSTRRSTSSTRSRRTSSRSRTRSSTGSTASTRSTSTARPGLTFAAGLRSILRADPDIIMVGEIRDAETARIAIESALTGHMVLSTLHTNDAPGTIARLAKMGIESFLTASAIDCVVAQRLARKLCTALQAAHGDLRRRRCCEAGFRVGADLEAYEPVGCARCNQYRLPRPDRALLGDGDERADQGADRRAAPPRRRSPTSPARRACSPARGRAAQGPRRRHLDRRGRPRRLLTQRGVRANASALKLCDRADD